jgi:hypothetical protein
MEECASSASLSWDLTRRERDHFIKDFGFNATAALIAYFVKELSDPRLSHAPALVVFTILAMMTSLKHIQDEGFASHAG